MARPKELTDDVAAVLREATVNGNMLILNGTLDREKYAAVMKAISAIGGKWDKRSKSHVFDRPVQPMLNEMLGNGVIPATNILAFFRTGEKVIDDMLDLVAFSVGMRVLEPSSGDGAIIRAVLEATSTVKVDAYEIDPVRHAQSAAAGAYMCGNDFLAAAPRPVYDVVLMNPPFTAEGSQQVYMDHIQHAVKFLKPGGELVAIAPNGFTFRADKKAVAFNEWLVTFAVADVISLSSDAFKESGTGVNTVMIHLVLYK